MRVDVLYFAALREQRGMPSETLEVDDPTTVGELYHQIFGPHPPVAAMTVDRRVCGSATPLTDGCEVSFLPPLGGG